MVISINSNDVVLHNLPPWLTYKSHCRKCFKHVDLSGSKDDEGSVDADDEEEHGNNAEQSINDEEREDDNEVSSSDW